MYKSITLQLTTQCSLKCPYCFAPELSKNNISEENLRYFYAFCHRNKPDRIHLTGGEPTMHPAFIEIVNHLLKVTAVTVYSNLTIPSTWEKTNDLNISNLTVLINLNDRAFYSDVQWKTFKNNLSILSKKKCHLAISHTFFRNHYESTFDYIFDFMRKYNLTDLRVSHYVKKEDSTFGLDIEQVRHLYDFVSDNIVNWNQIGLNVFFDCAVPPCFLKRDTFYKLYGLKVLGTKCCPKAFVLWDLCVTHCYTTIEQTHMRKLTEFQSIEEIVSNSSRILNEKLCGKSKSLCNACVLKTSFCNCPDYHLFPNEKLPQITHL